MECWTRKNLVNVPNTSLKWNIFKWHSRDRCSCSSQRQNGIFSNGSLPTIPLAIATCDSFFSFSSNFFLKDSEQLYRKNAQTDRQTNRQAGRQTQLRVHGVFELRHARFADQHPRDRKYQRSRLFSTLFNVQRFSRARSMMMTQVHVHDHNRERKHGSSKHRRPCLDNKAPRSSLVFQNKKWLQPSSTFSSIDLSVFLLVLFW